MTPTFRHLYDICNQTKTKNVAKKRELLYEANPNKIKALMYLLEYH